MDCMCIQIDDYWFKKLLAYKGRFQKSREFSILSKNHPPDSPSMEKKIRITWSKYKFQAKISILSKKFSLHRKSVRQLI